MEPGRATSGGRGGHDFSTKQTTQTMKQNRPKQNVSSGECVARWRPAWAQPKQVRTRRNGAEPNATDVNNRATQARALPEIAWVNAPMHPAGYRRCCTAQRSGAAVASRTVMGAKAIVRTAGLTDVVSQPSVRG